MLESISEVGREFVGSCGLGPRTVYVNGRPVRAGLLADFTVDKAHRTVMPALILQRAVAEYACREFDLAYTYPNDAAIGLFSRIGYHKVGQAGRYVRILRTGPYVSRILTNPLLGRLGGALADGGLQAFDTVRPLLRGLGLTVTWPRSLDQRFDTLFERTRLRYKVIGDRSAAFLTWRFLNRPGVNGRIAALVSRSGELHAYAVISDREPGTALLADFLADSNAHLAILLGRLMQPLRAAGYTTVMTSFLGEHATAKVLESQGFRLRNLSKFIVANVGSSGIVNEAELRDSESWYLTEADRDN